MNNEINTDNNIANNKTAFNIIVGKRLQKAMQDQHLNQKMVLQLCEEKNYNIGQPTLSKCLSGSSIQPLYIAQLCEVLNLNISSVMSFDPNEEINCAPVSSVAFGKLITSAEYEAFDKYKGEYHGYFYTTKNEEQLHHGIFKILDDNNGNCMASFSFKTGEYNRDGEEIEKKYKGPVTFSQPMQAFYVELRSDVIGEICYMIFHYDHLNYQELECRLAAVITISSGVKRLPTMHKFLFTRQELSEEDELFLRGQLKLNSSEIVMSENAYRGMLTNANLPESFKEYFGVKENEQEDGFTASVAKNISYQFNESLISDSFLPSEDKAKIIGLIRNYSSSQRCNKISAKAEETIYKYLDNKKNRNSHFDIKREDLCKDERLSMKDQGFE